MIQGYIPGMVCEAGIFYGLQWKNLKPESNLMDCICVNKEKAIMLSKEYCQPFCNPAIVPVDENCRFLNPENSIILK